MNKKNTKPKFIPPISTAASFLRSISKSPEPLIFPKQRVSIFREFKPDFPKDSNHLIRFTENSSNFSPRVSNATRDISHLKDSQKISKSTQQLPNPFPNLPTQVDHLKLLLDASDCQSRTSSRGGHLCHKEKCLEDFLDRSSDQLDKNFKHLEEMIYSAPSGSTTGKQDVHNLKEWFGYMKEKHLKNISKSAENLEDRKKILENFDIIIKTAMKEMIRQISIQSSDRGEVLNDLVNYSNKYYKLKNLQIIQELKAKISQLDHKNQEILHEKDKMLKENSAIIKQVRFNQLTFELESKKSTLVMKQVEIERLNDHVKRLKTDKVYRIKKELETYNQMLRTFKERENFKEDPSFKHDELKVKKKMQEANESINQIILAKMKLVEKTQRHESVVSESIEEPYKDQEIQAILKVETSEKSFQCQVEKNDVELETDELVDFVSFQATENLSNPEVTESKKTRVFKFRLRMEKASQTDGKLLIETMKKEEEDLINWMVKDRKDYLKGIQKQILVQKLELSKVKGKVVQSRVNLGDSLNIDIKSGSDVSSSYIIDDEMIDGEIENLRKLGIIGNEIEIDSWKHGYFFGFDKGRIEGFGDGEKLGLEKAELEKDIQLSFDSSQVELKIPRKSIRKATMAVEDIKKSRKVTKFQEFHFQRKNVKSETVIGGNKRNLLENFLSEPLSNIVKSSKMSKKLVLKTISGIYSSAVAKKNNLTELADFTYDEIFSKYSQKIMVGKKYLEFVAALLKYPDSRRVMTFVKLFGIGKKLGLEDYIRPKESFSFIVNLLEKISKSTLGIIIDVDETADYQFIPTIRAIECTKEVILPYVETNKLTQILDFINSKSFLDPKKINKSGIISQELLVDYLLDEINLHYKNYLTHLSELFKATSINKSANQVYKKDVVSLLRFVNQQKFENIVGNSDPIDLMNKFCRSGNESYEDLEKVQDLCVHFGFLTIHDASAVWNDETWNEDRNTVLEKEIQRNQEVFDKLFNQWKELGLDEEYSRILHEKLEKFSKSSESELKYFIVAWKTFVKEVNRLALGENQE